MKTLITVITVYAISFHLHAQNATHIDLTKAYFGEINAEKVFKNIEIIPLETHKDAFLNKEATYYLTDKYIIAIDFLRPAYLFDRKTGKFIREIGSYGEGPDEYTGHFFPLCGFDEDNNILFIWKLGPAFGRWNCINIETNKMVSPVRRPVPESKEKRYNEYSPWPLKKDMYVSYCNNRTGKDKLRLIVYDKDGKVLKKHPNYLEYKVKNTTSYPNNNGIFYYYKGQTFFKEWNYNDTVFSVNEKEMLPHIIFELGDKQSSYYHQDEGGYNKGRYLINFVHESDLYVLFNFQYVDANSRSKYPKFISHAGYYDKKSKRAYISSTPDLKEGGYKLSGIPTGFCPISINKKNEMITHIDPEELMNNIDKIDPKYKYLFKNIQEDDNPIVIIAKLKK